MKHYAILHNAQQGHEAILRTWELVKPWLVSGRKLELRISPERRNSEQNAKFHAICSDLARARIPWYGKPRDAAGWKVLLVSGHAVATKQGAEIIPGLEGEFVNIRESTALMSKDRGSSLIEYAVAFCAEHGLGETAL
jgi:NinB protein